MPLGMFTLRSGYTEADFARAVDVVGRQASPAAAVVSLGIEWDYLSWVALGIAQDVLGDASALAPDIVANGAEAFTAGLLIGVHLPERRDAPVDLGQRFPWAFDEVLERGRFTVIAEHCNLDSIGVLERIHATALLESLKLPERQIAALRGAFTQLLESGLATGLVLSREL